MAGLLSFLSLFCDEEEEEEPQMALTLPPIKGLMNQFDLNVRRLRGKDEYEIYRNYVHDLSEGALEAAMSIFFIFNVKEKDTNKATTLRNQGNVCFQIVKENYNKCIHLYTKSLRFSKYDSQEYAMALSNRSAVFYEIKDYKNCLMDIDLCLQAKYPMDLKPKVLIRKANCLKKLGKTAEMREILMDTLKILDSLPKSTAEKYEKMVSELIISKADELSTSDDADLNSLLPSMEQNSSFLNASDAVHFQYDKAKGYSVLAKQDIKRGDVLFVEKAYAFAPCRIRDTLLPNDTDVSKCSTVKHCQNCLAIVTGSCVPCKKCVKQLYCNEACRDTAWSEFHKWECPGIRADLLRLNYHGHLALRIIFKAVLTGLTVGDVNSEEQPSQYGNKDNNYTFLHNLPSNIDKISQDWLAVHTATAAILVHYLKGKTDFFKHLKSLPAFANKSIKEMANKIGGLILRHCAQLHCNSMPLKIFTNPPVDIDQPSPVRLITAVTACPSMAIMNHSCFPNTTHYFVGDVVIVKATEDIKATEEIFRSYSTMFHPRTDIQASYADPDDRKFILENFFFISCKCMGCTNPKVDVIDEKRADAHICIRCRGPAVSVPNRRAYAVACMDCNYKYSLHKSVVRKQELAVKYLLKFVKFGHIDDANKCLKITKSIFFSYNWIFAEVYKMLSVYHTLKGNVVGLLDASRKKIDILKDKGMHFSVEHALLFYGSCLCGTVTLKRVAATIDLQQYEEALNLLTDLLEETKDMFDIYYPPYMKGVTGMQKTLDELRALYMSRRTEE